VRSCKAPHLHRAGTRAPPTRHGMARSPSAVTLAVAHHTGRCHRLPSSFSFSVAVATPPVPLQRCHERLIEAKWLPHHICRRLITARPTHSLFSLTTNGRSKVPWSQRRVCIRARYELRGLSQAACLCKTGRCPQCRLQPREAGYRTPCRDSLMKYQPLPPASRTRPQSTASTHHCSLWIIPSPESGHLPQQGPDLAPALQTDPASTERGGLRCVRLCVRVCVCVRV